MVGEEGCSGEGEHTLKDKIQCSLMRIKEKDI